MTVASAVPGKGFHRRGKAIQLDRQAKEDVIACSTWSIFGVPEWALIPRSHGMALYVTAMIVTRFKARGTSPNSYLADVESRKISVLKPMLAGTHLHRIPIISKTRESRKRADERWGAVAGALGPSRMVWSNAASGVGTCTYISLWSSQCMPHRYVQKFNIYTIFVEEDVSSLREGEQ
jgi:hypothetical protein